MNKLNILYGHSIDLVKWFIARQNLTIQFVLDNYNLTDEQKSNL